MPSKKAMGIAQAYWPCDQYEHKHSDAERKHLATLIDEGVKELVEAASHSHTAFTVTIPRHMCMNEGALEHAGGHMDDRAKQLSTALEGWKVE